ncbi:hypothetical protein [Rhodanobacter sp. L36]|uniref:hypothetical protein n=1 Tax=Rhodanobacter sp. L36 TaxID=1747221 RepID=UPI00131E5795|nr:hypothetical protein [Rhodanobacter sp. L36]
MNSSALFSNGRFVLPAIFSLVVACLSGAASAAAPTLAAHPRLILDPTTLATLRLRAAANGAQWVALKKQCDSYIGGTVGYPTDATYPDLPNLGQGYEGESYLPALLAEGMCYQVLKTSNPTAAATYGAKAVDILMKMSTPFTTGSGNKGEDPCTDDGYVMRFFGVGFGLGYDWVYDLLTSTQRAQVYNTANQWIGKWQAVNGCSAFAYEHPQGNYYAGFFHAQVVIALATYEENSSAPGVWNDWLTNQFERRVQPYYAKHLTGGGWPEGFANYAPLGVLNMSLPVREVKTATGQDLVHGAAPYSYPLDMANYAMHFGWPSLNYFDDRDTNRSNSTTQPPGTPNLSLYQQVLGELYYWGSPLSAVFNQYRLSVSSATGQYGQADQWIGFLEVSPGAVVAPISTLPLSYLATGMGAVAARSNWTTSATWMSFRSGPYTNNPGQGEQDFDEGSLALVRGATPLLVNATGWAVHNPSGNTGENDVYTDNYGSFSSGNDASGNRRPYNIFFVRHMNGANLAESYGQAANTSEDDGARTTVTAYEDGSDHVFVQGRFLNDMYRRFSGGPAVSGWARNIVYLRPNRFVVYDRTTIGNASYDQYMAWHFPASPVSSTTAAGYNRLDVTYNNQYAGAMTTVLPAAAKVSTTTLYPDLKPSKFWETQVRPNNTAVGQQWLAVFDLSPAAAQVATVQPVTVTLGNINGVQLLASDGNTMVINNAGAANTTISGSFGYSVSLVAARNIVTELPANTGYTVTTSAGSSCTIRVTPGGTLKSSAKGVLDFLVNSNCTI